MKIFPSKEFRQYLKPGRLSDVLALIQVLALDPSTYRSEKGASINKAQGLQGEMQGPPESAKTWTEIAQDHPEFFRVNLKRDNAVSLIARHVTPKNEKNIRVLDEAFIGKLLELAVEIHDRQIKLAERWTYLIPVWVALLGGIIAITIQLL